MMLQFTVPGTPRGKGRPRIVRRNGRTWAYTPTATKHYERAVAMIALAARPADWPMDGRYSLRLTVSWPDARRRDLSNVQKAIEDACNHILWTDDCQIDGTSCNGGIDRIHPRVVVEVTTL